MTSNLDALRNRLVHVQKIIKKNKNWDESVNLFEIKKVGDTIPLDYMDKKKLESELS